MDASIYTEPIGSKAKKGKSSTPHAQKRAAKKQAKHDEELRKAASRLLVVLFRRHGSSFEIKLSQASLDRLSADPSAMTPSEVSSEIRSILFDTLDADGVVNHRVIKDDERSVRLMIIQEVWDAAVESGDIELTTRRSKLTVTLSKHQALEQAAKRDRHDRRVADRRTNARQNKRAA